MRFNGHNYNSQVGYKLRWYFKRITNWPVYPDSPNVTWFGHGDDCCDYWLPVDTPEAKRAFMLDDDFELKEEDS